MLAEFGTEMVGVFNKDYVDEASSVGYEYTTAPQNKGPIALGIDWDKMGAATQIVVTQYNPFDIRRPRPEIGLANPMYGRFQVINRVEIPKGEFTYDLAVQKIIELNEIYNPFAIYADAGAGEYQCEMLRKHIGEKVKRVHLGSSTMIRDPQSRTFEKKPIKPFIVNQTVLMMERGQVRIPHRDYDETFARQMTNYQVQRYSPKTGEPTYSSEDEHALDALMFTLFAFIEQMPELAETVEQKPAAKTIGMIPKAYNDPIKNQQLKSSEDKSELRQKPKRAGFKRKNQESSSFSWGSRGLGSTRMPSRSGW